MGTDATEGHDVTQGKEVDLELLFRLRLVLARIGEMDVAKWWNTQGQLGRLGAMALRRGFARSYRFAQARSVFAVAAHRSKERLAVPGALTLFSLTPEIEAEFDLRWDAWLRDRARWEQTFAAVEAISARDLDDRAALETALVRLAELNDAELRAAREAVTHASSTDRGVLVASPFAGTRADLVALAVGHLRSAPAQLVVPYAEAAP